MNWFLLISRPLEAALARKMDSPRDPSTQRPPPKTDAASMASAR